ncbi:phage major capsid protein [Paenibacillus rhizolycopersici]|uniref:phage major capsid protein n=1 Tax=Paenibacillus rhizolycopersici TaxID=2780073 RepID=UPI003D2BEF28
MNKEQYLNQRKKLMNEAESLLNEGKFKESESKMDEVKELDNKWEAIALANANLNALKENAKVTELENKSVTVEGGKTVENIVQPKPIDDKKAYENAWAKYMQGSKLEGQEKELFDKVNREFSNAYTHDTTNTAILIPETVVAGIWKRAEEMYPLLADVRKFSVSGTLTMKKHTGIAAGDAAFYDEDTATADEQNNFGEITLSGCELAKAITITWKLRSMAMAEFIPFITNELGERVGVALGKAVASGKGASATPREPQGVETALLAESGTPQVVTYDPDHATTPVPLTYKKVTEAIAKIHSSYLSGAAIYANNATIWTELANLMDDNGRPLFIPDVTSGGVGRMFGFVVKPDAGVTAGNILIGNANAGYIMNTNEPMSVATEEHVKARTVDYAAYTIVDGAVLDTKAFALIRNIPNA